MVCLSRLDGVEAEFLCKHCDETFDLLREAFDRLVLEIRSKGELFLFCLALSLFSWHGQQHLPIRHTLTPLMLPKPRARQQPLYGRGRQASQLM